MFSFSHQNFRLCEPYDDSCGQVQLKWQVTPMHRSLTEDFDDRGQPHPNISARNLHVPSSSQPRPKRPRRSLRRNREVRPRPEAAVSSPRLVTRRIGGLCRREPEPI